MDAAILDTDTLSEIIRRRNFVVAENAAAYLRAHRLLAFSVITKFEVIRGYRLRQSWSQLRRFEEICQRSMIFAVDDDIFDCAADLWGQAKRLGLPAGDADLLIAATALRRDRVLVTGNVRHFNWIAGLQMVNWRD